MKTLKITCALLLIAFLFPLQGQNAVETISKEVLLPVYREAAYPSSGVVMYSAPSFLCPPVIKSKSGVNTYKFDFSYSYQFRISQEVDFTGPTTIISPVQEWTFYNTHKTLAKGQWYWQYAYVKGDETIWKEAIPFTITGDEVDFVTPSFDEFVSKIDNWHPRILTTPDKLGKTIYPQDKVAKMTKRIDKKIDKPLPAMIYADQAVMAKKKKELSEERYQMYITKRTRDNCKKFSSETAEVVMLYVLTKDKKYLDESLRRYRHFAKVYEEIVEIGQWLDFTEVAFHSVQSEVFDIAYEYLTEDEIADVVASISEGQRESFEHLLHKPSHKLHDSHFWQIELRNFFMNSYVLIHHSEEAKKWLQYAYELYVVRAPTGSLNDGGWAPGNKYFGANAETLFVLPYMLSRITGFNYFSKPWYKNVSAYLMYTSPIGCLSGSFGDATDAKGENMMGLVRAINRVQKDPYATFYDNLYVTKGKNETDKDSRMLWYSYQALELDAEQQTPDFTNAKDFRDVGTVAMHTDLDEPDDNMFVAFRSSPFGVIGHSHAAQNSFSIFYGGEPLFYHTGYYSNWADFHTLQSYRHTRAHNSILVDGIGQNYHTSGYGWIARFLTSETISYSLGDASRAYSGDIMRDEIMKQMKKYDLEPTPEFGFGDPGLELFRRHIFMLRPGTVLIYDEMEAKQPVEWTWLSNARCQMTLKGDNGLALESNSSKADMQLFSSVDFTQNLSDEFLAPAVDWQGKGAGKVNTEETSYHYKAVTEKAAKARFLSIIQVGDVKAKSKKIKQNDNTFTVGEWEITAEMDSDKPASFIITNGKDAHISMGYEQIEIDGEHFAPQDAKATLLIEKVDGQWQVKEEGDQLPDAAKFF